VRRFRVLLLSCLLITSVNSFADQQQNANLYVNWKVSLPQNYSTVSQELRTANYTEDGRYLLGELMVFCWRKLWRLHGSANQL
jgi:hypothetical protein